MNMTFTHISHNVLLFRLFFIKIIQVTKGSRMLALNISSNGNSVEWYNYMDTSVIVCLCEIVIVIFVSYRCFSLLVVLYVQVPEIIPSCS